MNKESLQKVIHGTRDERVYLCERDFALFFVFYQVEYIKYRFAPFHFDMFRDIEDLMNDVIRELVWIGFRESAKTSLAKSYVLWLITFKKRMYINADSFDKENAERLLFDIVVEMQTNQRYRADFGEMYNTKRNADEVTQKRISNFVTNNGVRVEAHSTGESVRGRLHGHQRPDFLLLDDFETNKTKDSLAHTKQVVDHISEFKGGLDGTAKVLYLCNYITEIGSVQTLIDRAKTDKGIRIRQIDAEVQDSQGNWIPSWGEKYTMTDAEAEKFKKENPDKRAKISLEDRKRQLGSLTYSAEMMNRPIDEASQEFFKKNFKYRTRDQLRNMRTRKFATIDSALTKNAKSDGTGITKNEVDEQNNWNLSARKYKINSKELVNIIFQLHDDGFEKIGIEEGAFTEAIQPYFEEECRVRNKYPYIVKLKHGGIMKETRIRGLIPRYEAGTIYHIEGECTDLEEELLKFPKSPHDDVMDATQYQNKIAEPPFPASHEKMIDSEDEVLYRDIGI